jgi:hypothetical protein
MSRLRTAIRDWIEVHDGFEFRLNGSTISLPPDVAEWMTMECLCCPLLTFQLSVAGNRTDQWLKLGGSEGVKPVVQAEFLAN